MGCGSDIVYDAEGNAFDVKNRTPKDIPDFPQEIFEQIIEIHKVNEDELRKIFKKYDKDKSNTIDMRELASVFSQENGFQHIKPEILQIFLDICDENDNGTLEFDEFLQVAYIIANTSDSISKERIMFFYADKNMSGAISFREFLKIIKKTTNLHDFDALDLFKKGAHKVTNIMNFAVFCYIMERLLK